MAMTQSNLLPPLQEGAEPPAPQQPAGQKSTLLPPMPEEAPYHPAENPTTWSELERTPAFIANAPQDIGESYYNAASQAWDDLSSKTDNWLDFFKRKGRGALGVAGLPAAGLTPALAHTLAASAHVAGSLASPKQASLDVPDTINKPYQGEGGEEGPGWKDVLLPKILGGDLNPHPNKPRGLVSSFKPAAEIGSMLQRPQGATPMRMEKMPPSQYHSGDIFGHGSQQYDEIKRLGGKFDPDAVSESADAIQSSLKEAGYPRRDKDFRPLWGAVDELRHLGPEPTFQDLDRVRKTVNKFGEKEGMSHAAAVARTGIDDFWRSVTGQDMTGNPEVAPLLNKAVHDARLDWTQASKLEMLENFKATAELGEHKVLGPRDMAQVLVNTATRLLDPKNKQILRGWSDAEVKGLERVSQGTIPQWIAGKLGKLAPEFGASPVETMHNLLHGAVYYFGGPQVSIPFAGITLAAKKFAEGATRRNWENLQGLIAQNSPGYQALHEASRVARKAPITSAINLAHQMAQQRTANPNNPGNSQ